MQIKYFGFLLLTLLLSYTLSATAASVTPAELMGEYELISISVSNSYGTFSDFSSLEGHASATTKGLVIEMSGYNSNFGSVSYYACGFYSLWANSETMTVSIKGGSSKSVGFSLHGETLTTSWSDTVEGVSTNFTCDWHKTQNYYSHPNRVVVIPLNSK